MKRLAVAAFLLTSNIAISATSVTVQGYGTDRESAKLDAFKTAIENVCGAAVLSDRENKNSVNTYNNVLSYSSCRVENYDIINYSDNVITVRVSLVDNRISQRLFSESNSRAEFNTDTVQSQIQTLKLQQRNGDKLIDAVFRDYPYRAYNLNKAKMPYISNDAYRNLYLMVPYDITWNYNFIQAMVNTFATVQTSNGAGKIVVMAKNPNNVVLGHRDIFFIDDLYRLEHIKEKFTTGNELRLRIKARDVAGKNVLNICYNPEYQTGGIFYSIGVDNKLAIFGNDRNEGTVKIKLNIPAEVIRDIGVDIIAEKDCKLY